MTIREYLNTHQITLLELSKRSGISAPNIGRFLNGRQELGLKSRHKLAKLGIDDFTRPPYREEVKNIYAVYKGDQLLVVGTADECAKCLGLKVNTIYTYTPLSRLKNLDKGTYAIKIEED